jgi:Ca2+-binding RTX toxin-like protein
MALAGNDTITTGGGNDIHDGGVGADIMADGAGNDTYYVDNVGDVTQKVAGAGTEAVFASINWTLVDNIENSTLEGSATQGTGNALDKSRGIGVVESLRMSAFYIALALVFGVWVWSTLGAEWPIGNFSNANAEKFALSKRVPAMVRIL